MRLPAFETIGHGRRKWRVGVSVLPLSAFKAAVIRSFGDSGAAGDSRALGSPGASASSQSHSPRRPSLRDIPLSEPGLRPPHILMKSYEAG